MPDVAIIGGTGLTRLEDLKITRREVVYTPYGEPSGVVTHGVMHDKEIAFLARHGYGHTIPPHRVNYRANIWALKHIGVKRVLAVAAVGGIRHDMQPGMLVIPDQIIDYTYGRAHTLHESEQEPVTHIDFTHPYCAELRALIIRAAKDAEVKAVFGGTYGATQGPRLETAMEIDRLERDRCDIVGMTGMPEASLARELGLSYAACAVVANWAAGRGGEEEITAEIIAKHLKRGMRQVALLLDQFFAEV